jgi:NADH-quinone oxidoreductase subunit K
MITVTHYVALSAILFTIGVVGVLIRRTAILILMAVELMLNAANLALVAFARYFDHLDGQIISFFVMTVAASEVAVGLALIVTVFKTKHSVDVDEINSMQG